MQGYSDGRMRLRAGKYRVIYRYDVDNKITVKRFVLAWDPDFTKVTPEERKRIDEAEASGFVSDDEIDWDNLDKYAE